MIWLLLTLIFIRPFISSLAFGYLNFACSFLFIVTCFFWVLLKKPSGANLASTRYPILLFIISLAFSLGFSHNKAVSTFELYKYLTGILLFIIGISLSYRERDKIILCVTLAGFIISILAIYQYLFGFKHILLYLAKQENPDAFAMDYVKRSRVFFPFLTPNTLAGYLAMIIPFTFIRQKKFWLIIPMLIALLLTQSLGGILSIILATTIYLSLQRKLLAERKIIFVIISVLIVIAGVIFVRMQNAALHTHPIFSTTMRLSYWKDTLRIIKEHPLTGLGLGNFNIAPSRYAHNSYLQLWAEMGILGLISWLWIVFQSLKVGLKKIRSITEDNRVTIVLLTASSAFLIHNFVDFSFFLPEISWIWWLIIGLLFV